jgi:acetyl-CoA synthetase
MYTSGSTGPPKGVRHSHALWLGRAAAAYNYFEGGLGPDAVCWTPADWAWGGALGGLVFAAWHHGATVVGAATGSFDAERAFARLADHDVTHAFVPPTALRMLMQVEAPTDRYDLSSLSVLAAAGEPLTPEILAWADAELGVPVNEFYGQTELNLVVATCGHWFDARPGSMGKPLPGYDVRLLDPETGPPVETGETGEIAVRPHDDRVVFDEYWGLPEATAEKQHEGWYLTGDLAERDEDGYLWFVSRKDDLIITSGYRVGPGEVEEVVLEHPAVEQVGVVGVPDETRGERIKAFVQPAGEYDPDVLREEIQELVRERLAKYEYPREIEFVEELPTTTTGKIRRASLRDRA